MRGLRVLVLALACAALLAAPAAAQQPGPTLTVARAGDSLWLDPARAYDTESTLADAQIYEGLVRLKDGGAGVEPCLAESWSVSEGGLAWTFRLRRGVLFHDGTALNAQAVAMSIQRQIDPAHPYHTPGMYQARSLFAEVASVQAVDDATVRFKLKRPVASFLDVLAAPCAAVVSPSALARRGVDLAHRPVGTGPFLFAERRRGESLTLARNASYWGPKALVERLVLRTVPDAGERFRAIQSGRADVMTGIPPSDLALLEKTPGVRLLRTAGLNVAYLAMNTRRAPFKNAAARRAVQLALDKPGLVRLAYGLRAEPARTLVPPLLLAGAPQLDEILPALKPDPAQARRMLAQEGAAASPLTLLVMDTPRTYMPEPSRLAQAVRQNLEAVGLRVTVRTVGWAGYLSRLSKGDFDLCLLGWVSDTTDPHEVLRNVAGWDELGQGLGSNVSFWKSERYQDLVNRAEVTQDPAERLVLYLQALRLLREEAPLVPLAHVQEAAAVRQNVSGVVQQPAGSVLRFHRAQRP